MRIQNPARMGSEGTSYERWLVGFNEESEDGMLTMHTLFICRSKPAADLAYEAVKQKFPHPMIVGQLDSRPHLIGLREAIHAERRYATRYWTTIAELLEWASLNKVELPAFAREAREFEGGMSALHRLREAVDRAIEASEFGGRLSQ